MSIPDAAREILVEGDFRKLRRVWNEALPHLANVRPKTDGDAEIVLHHARTQAATVPFKLRAYSHSWLTERSLPSGLPDGLRPRAERMYPRIAAAVGIAVKATGSDNPLMREAGLIVQRSMQDAVSEAFADGRTDPQFVRGRMKEARQRTHRQLFGRLKGSRT